MKVRVRFFHNLEPSRSGKVEVELKDGSTVKDLLEKLIEMYGGAFERGIWGQDRKLFIAIMVNGVSTRPGTGLREGDEIAIVPPVAGGCA